MSSPQESPAFVALVQAAAGATGGVFASFVLQPLEVVKTRVQVSRGGVSTFDTAVEVLKTEGFGALFRGVGTKCTETGSKNFVYFYIYDTLNQVVKKSTKLSTAMKLLVGYVAGVGTTTATMPLEVLSTKLTLDTSGAGAAAVVSSIIQEDGLTGLFRGFWFNIALCVNPAIQNTVFDRIKAVVLKAKGSKNAVLSPLQAFVLGAVAKAVATILTFPLVRLKTILQAESGGREKQETQAPAKRAVQVSNAVRPLCRSDSAAQMLQEISYRTDKEPSEQGIIQRFEQLYRGVGSALTKSVLQAALLYMTKDQVEQVVVTAFKVSTKMLRRRSGKVKLGAFSGRPLAS